MKIAKDKCVGCANCIPICPVGAIYIGADGLSEINSETCVECHNCFRSLSLEHLPPGPTRLVRKLLKAISLRFQPDPDVCPTDAIVAPYQLDARRCISYLTIESKEPIPVELRKAIGNRIYGCDDCQLYCPWNKFARRSDESDFATRHDLHEADLVELFQWSEQTWLEKTEGSAIRRIGYERWLRNIAVALGNAGTTPAVVEALNKRRNCDSKLVAEHVAWALTQHE